LKVVPAVEQPVCCLGECQLAKTNSEFGTSLRVWKHRCLHSSSWDVLYRYGLIEQMPPVLLKVPLESYSSYILLLIPIVRVNTVKRNCIFLNTRHN